MTTTTTVHDHWNGWACLDCMIWLANGDTPPEMSEEETTAWLDAIIERTAETSHVTVGRMLGEDGCEHRQLCEEHIDQCERDDFSWTPCDHCGSTLAGFRYAITGWLE